MVLKATVEERRLMVSAAFAWVNAAKPRTSPAVAASQRRRLGVAIS